MRNFFSALGLEPGEYTDAAIRQRFESRRSALLSRLHDPRHRRDAWTRLDELHLGYRALRTEDLRTSHLEDLAAADNAGAAPPHRAIRRLIAASFEDGLLRCSRRRRILDFAAQAGVDEFETQILIAEEQYGRPVRLGTKFASVNPETGHLSVQSDEPDAARRAWVDGLAPNAKVRLAATGAIAAAMTICLAFWLGV
jgi:hypothetical protein